MGHHNIHRSFTSSRRAFLEHNVLHARVYDTYQDIVDACGSAWSSLLNIKGQLKSITTRSWAKAVSL